MLASTCIDCEQHVELDGTLRFPDKDAVAILAWLRIPYCVIELCD